MTDVTDVAQDSVRVRHSRAMSYQQVLDTDTHAVPSVLRIDGDEFLGGGDICVDRYISREYHELEKQHLWPKVWQMACREEEIPRVGDAYVYDIVDTSILVVRISPTEINAYYNVCLHQGRQLRDHDSSNTELRCPFHGFCWNLDGTLKRVPSTWNYPTVIPENFSLKQVRAQTWGGFVFINMDPSAPSLHDYLGEIDQHFERYPLDERYISVHVAKVLPCNWKTAQEAFMEAFHNVATHPQILAATGDENSQYDVFGNFSRAITMSGVPSAALDWAPSENDMAEVAFRAANTDTDGEAPQVPDGMTFREWGAQGGRDMLRPVIGDKADELCDSEPMDSFYLSVFPNFHPWASYNRITYRFRPYGDEHEKCIMETYLLEPFSGDRPPPAPVHWLGLDQTHLDAPELGVLAQIFYQDELNMPSVQKGMRTLSRAKPSGTTLGVYQYLKIRHFHGLYDQYIPPNEAG